MISPEFSVSASHLFGSQEQSCQSNPVELHRAFLVVNAFDLPVSPWKCKAWSIPPVTRETQKCRFQFGSATPAGPTWYWWIFTVSSEWHSWPPSKIGNLQLPYTWWCRLSRPLVMGTSLLLMRRRFLWLCTYFWALFWWPKLSTMCPRLFRPKFWKFLPYERIWRPWFYMFLASFFTTFLQLLRFMLIVFTVPGIVGLGQCWDRCKPTPSGKVFVWPRNEEGMWPMASLHQRHDDFPVLRLAVGPWWFQPYALFSTTEMGWRFWRTIFSVGLKLSARCCSFASTKIARVRMDLPRLRGV